MPPVPKPSLAPLKTSASPKATSTKFPSELEDSPLPSARLEAIRHEDLLKTPITPPSAYTDLLNTLTPMLTSNLPSATTEKSSDRSIYFSQPPSATTTSTSFSSRGSARSPAFRSPAIIIPSPSVSRWPQSARTPRSLRPLAISPINESPRSASSARTQFSPHDWSLESGIRYFDAPGSATSSSGRPVKMRQVITRTITYKRTPLDPAPKGKRRKIEDKKDKKDKKVKKDKTSKTDKTDKSDKSDKADKADKTDPNDKSDKNDKTQKTDKVDKNDKTEETDKKDLKSQEKK